MYVLCMYYLRTSSYVPTVEAQPKGTGCAKRAGSRRGRRDGEPDGDAPSVSSTSYMYVYTNTYRDVFLPAPVPACSCIGLSYSSSSLSLSPPPHKDQNQTQQILRYGTAGALVRLEVRVEGLAIGAPPRGGSVGQIVVLGGGGGGEGGVAFERRGEKASVRAGRTRAS